jgi:hypothetical protein
VKRAPFIVLTALILAGALSGCVGANVTEPHPPVIDHIPWQGPESLRYHIIESRGEVSGKCTLVTRPEFEPGKTQLSQLCDDGAVHRDDRIALVDATTLAPISTSRTIANEEKNTRTTFEAAYDGVTANLKADSDGKKSTTTRTLPRPTQKVPNPAWYDDESLFWVIRAIPLRVGHTATYTNLNPGNGRVFDVAIDVEVQEKVKVPAGEFEAWKVKVKTESITQYFWIEAASPNRVIKARIERIVYELLPSE